jgi:hypothetical protein
MTECRTLLYFGHVPCEGAGSAIIVLRHLQRFAADGWNIRVVADWGQDHTHCNEANWPVTTLSHRKCWWPPFDANAGISRGFRAWLWAGEAHAWLHDTKIDGVLTYLSAFSDTLSIAAVGFARRYGLPLAVLVHDDTRCFVEAEAGRRAHRRRQWILANSTKGWFASPELASCFTLDARKVGILPPIPEGAPPAGENQSEDANPVTPLLVYAGNYWPPQLPALARIAAAAQAGGGRLLAVLKENSEHVAYLRTNGVEWRAPFARNTEALDYYRRHASALVVSYAETSDEMPWTRSSFPSKLIEYCHLGVPIVIVAPMDTAIAGWARARNFRDIFTPDDQAGLSAYVNRLHESAFRRDCAARALDFASGEFNPQTIQQALETTFLLQ